MRLREGKNIEKVSGETKRKEKRRKAEKEREVICTEQKKRKGDIEKRRVNGGREK